MGVATNTSALMQRLPLRIALRPPLERNGPLGQILTHRLFICSLLAHLVAQHVPTNRETLVSLPAARLRAHWATSSSRVIVTCTKVEYIHYPAGFLFSSLSRGPKLGGECPQL
jgi:hypothetical protein